MIMDIDAIPNASNNDFKNVVFICTPLLIH